MAGWGPRPVFLIFILIRIWWRIKKAHPVVPVLAKDVSFLVTEHLAILTEIHPFKQRSALA
jgi:hypothetical protein